MAKPPAPSGWKRLRLPAPSSWRVVFSLFGVPPPPAPSRTPQTRRGVEANGDSWQLQVCPLTLEWLMVELEGDNVLVYPLLLRSAACSPLCCDWADCPEQCDFSSVCFTPAHRSSRILQRNKKANPSPPHPRKKIRWNFFFAIKKVQRNCWVTWCHTLEVNSGTTLQIYKSLSGRSSSK